MKTKTLIILIAALAAWCLPAQASQANSPDNNSAGLTAINPASDDADISQPINFQTDDQDHALITAVPPNDECASAIQINGPFPTDIYGTTIDATVDCPDGFNGNAVWYKFNAPDAYNEIIVDYCLTENENIDFAGEFLYSTCPINALTCADYIEAYQVNFVTCPNGYNNARVRWLGLPGPATYYLPVYFNVDTDFGFTIDVIEYSQAVVGCPGDAQIELETCGSASNDGCLMDPGPPAFESIACDTMVCGTYWSNFYYRDTDWYQLDLAERAFVRWSAVGEAPTRIWIYDGTGGCDGVFLGSAAAEPGIITSLELELFPGTYWLVVGGDGWFDMPCDGSGMFTNDYVAIVDCEPGTPVIDADPTSIYGEALEGFTDTETLTVSNIGTGRLVFVAEATQNLSLTAGNDGSNSDNSRCLANSEIDVESLLSPIKSADTDALFEALAIDPYQADGSQQPPSVLVDCPVSGIAEAEPCGSDLNGGCAMLPGTETFEPFDCNTTVCGTVWSDGTIRDTDWYVLNLTEPAYFLLSVTADFPLLTFLILPGSPGNECDDYQALYFASAVAGDTAKIFSSLPAGTYWLWIGPTAWYNQPCDGSGDYGNDYVASVKCEPPWLTIDVLSGVIHEGNPPVEISVLMDATNLLPGIYTGNIKLVSNDHTNTPLDIPVTFVVNEVYLYIPGDANMGNSIWPAEVSGADVTYLIRYFDRVQSWPCVYDGFYASADANGDCRIIGSDLTYLVQYLRGAVPVPEGCPDYPHIPPIEETYPTCTVIPYPPVVLDAGVAKNTASPGQSE